MSSDVDEEETVEAQLDAAAAMLFVLRSFARATISHVILVFRGKKLPEVLCVSG